MRARTAGNLP